ncbi:unnamed protein product [Brassica oleracea]
MANNHRCVETMFVKRYPFRGSSSSAGKHSSPPPQTVNESYEIDHSVLRSPEQLKSIRIVMVSRITGRDVWPGICFTGESHLTKFP